VSRHLKIVGWMYFGVGAAMLAVGAIGAAVYGGMLLLGHPQGDAAAVPVIGLILMSIIVVMSIPLVTVGRALLRLDPWGQSMGTVVSALCLLFFPVGTVIGAYALWVLLQPGTGRLLARRTAAEEAA
jgi:hypothetical protein